MRFIAKLIDDRSISATSARKYFGQASGCHQRMFYRGSSRGRAARAAPDGGSARLAQRDNDQCDHLGVRRGRRVARGAQAAAEHAEAGAQAECGELLSGSDRVRESRPAGRGA